MALIKPNNVFTGYSNFRDITNMPRTRLAAGSLNTFINDGEKVEPRAGMDYFGIAGTQGNQTNPYWTLAHRIHSKYDDFVNKQGIKIPVRVFYDGSTTIGDVLEVWLPIYSGGLPTANSKWYRINPLAPSQPVLSTHRYYWAEWFDSTLSVVQPELIFTYGDQVIANWSGGFANITAVGGGSLTTDTTWEEKGFIWAPEGVNTIVVNGVQIIVTGGFGTNTITVSSTAGISVDDIAFQSIYFNDTLGGKTTYDVCSYINNQVYYEDWNQRNVYISWNRNQNPSNDGLGIYPLNIPFTTFSGTGLNDGLYDINGVYSGGLGNSYRVMIDGVATLTTNISSLSVLNDITFTGIWAAPAETFIITIDSLQANYTSISGTFNIGELVTGSLSSATGVIGFDTGGSMNLTQIEGTFSVGDVLTGADSGATATATDYVDTYNAVDSTGTGIAGPYVPITITPQNLTGNLFMQWQFLTGHTINTQWIYHVDTNTGNDQDSYAFYKNGVLVNEHNQIFGGTTQTLGADNMAFMFLNSGGHTKSDSWGTFPDALIARGYSNFTYANPNRLPGQGFTLLLDSNGWTMKPQEHTMLINAQAGHFYDIELKLSSNLLTESVVVTRLKSEPQNKVLFPYLIRYVQNQLSTISQDKTYNILGRQKFLELQQLKTLSDEVRIDFETADWEDADILYFKRKIYFCLPKMSLIFVWDDYKKYWHSPQQFGKRISLLSVIDDKLIGHSYEQDESYELFVGLNDLGVFPIHTKMIFPYESFGYRLSEKAVSTIGFEGYMDGLPVINWTINAGFGGCEGKKTGVIAPQNTPQGICVPGDTASLGKSGLGFHGLGNDPVNVIPHFYYVKTFDNMTFYLRNIELSCDSLDQRWSIISLGTDVSLANINNESITDPN